MSDIRRITAKKGNLGYAYIAHFRDGRTKRARSSGLNRRFKFAHYYEQPINSFNGLGGHFVLSMDGKARQASQGKIFEIGGDL